MKFLNHLERFVLRQRLKIHWRMIVRIKAEIRKKGLDVYGKREPRTLYTMLNHWEVRAERLMKRLDELTDAAAKTH